MGEVLGIQGPTNIKNKIFGSAVIDSLSSYVSLSGVKSILLNAWNAIKSAASNVLLSFGNHLSGQQGSEKTGRDITMDIASRPAQSLPGSGYTNTENIYATVDKMADIREPVTPQIPDSARPVLTEGIYSEINDPLYEDIDGYQPGAESTPPPVPTSPRPSLSGLPGRDAESEEMESVYQSSDEGIHTEPCDSQKAVSTPENDPRKDNDYDIPWKSYSDNVVIAAHYE